MKNHIQALRGLFPNASMIRDGYHFDDRKKGISIWTSFAEEGIIDYYGRTQFHPILEEYMEKNGLYVEFYDPGTAFIFKK